MSQPEARAWWADVEDLRERIERRREAEPTATPRARVATAPPRAPPRRAGTVQITGRPRAARRRRGPLVASRASAPTARAGRRDPRAPTASPAGPRCSGSCSCCVSTATH